MPNSILLTIKKMLGLDAGYEAFDTDIIVHINSALFTLMQIGVGPAEGFIVTGPSETWSDFLDSHRDLESVKSYVYMRTRLAFDPPQSSSVIKVLEDMCREYEWRNLVQTDDTGGEDD